MKTAIVFGSSGFVGSYLLAGLLNNSGYKEVIAVARKGLHKDHSRLRTLIGDYDSVASLKTEIAADEVYITLGTTRANSPKKAEYYQVDHDYPVLAARIAKERGARSVFLVTAVGANPNSKFFYVRTKGETERDVIALDFEHTHVFRPSMIIGTRENTRSVLEQTLVKVWPRLDPFFTWKDGMYKAMTGEDIARAMIQSAMNQTKKVQVYQWGEMQSLLQGIHTGP